MTKLEQLSKISNAVLTPHLNRKHNFNPFKGDTRNAKYFNCNPNITAEEKAFRVKWCERQKEIIGEFGAVLGG